MRYVIVDLEATCWEGVRAVGEIIEIGAVILASSRAPLAELIIQPVRPVTLLLTVKEEEKLRQNKKDQAKILSVLAQESVEKIKAS